MHDGHAAHTQYAEGRLCLGFCGCLGLFDGGGPLISETWTGFSGKKNFICPSRKNRFDHQPQTIHHLATWKESSIK